MKDSKKDDNIGESVKVWKSYEGLIIVMPIVIPIIIPKKICERLSIIEGSQIDIEPYNSYGEFGARIKPNK